MLEAAQAIDHGEHDFRVGRYGELTDEVEIHVLILQGST
jgi:hypothetical protein